MFKELSFNQKLFLSFILFTMFLAGCSSEDSSGYGISFGIPESIEITAKHEEFTVQFSKTAGIGVGDNKVLPKYYFYINEKDDISSAKRLKTSDGLDYVQQEDDGSGLMRQFIKPKKLDSDGSNIVLEYPIEDRKEYFIYLQTCFDGYGCSNDYTKTSAVPVPYPSKLTEKDVEVIAGDKTILIKITNKSEFDEYGILADNDKNECASEKLPRFDPKYETANDNYVITGLKNDNGSYNVCIRAQNINTDISNPDTISWLQLGNWTPKTSIQAPAKPEINLASTGHKRVSINWEGDFYGGDNSVSEYEIVYTDEKGQETTVLVFTDTYNIEDTILKLENNKEYNIKVKAINSAGETFSNEISATPENKPIDFNNLDTVLGKTTARFIYAEDIPHSDFWRIDESHKQGGRPSTDRLVRGKETALGNLWSDAVQYYVTEKLEENIDFTVLVGEMISNGMEKGVNITPRLLMKLTPIDYIDDKIVIISLKGEYLINNNDYNINLNDYPSLEDRATLFGQAAAVYRNGHYGTGAGATAYSTKAWLMPSKQVKYEIEYLPYDLSEFEENFKKQCGDVKDFADYDSRNDPNGCYLLKYDDVVDYDSPKEGYRRGRIKKDTLKINGQSIDSNKIYEIATTKKIADSIYKAFLNNGIQNTNIELWKAVADYINETGNIAPYLDGRVKLSGGVPGNTTNDFKEEKK